MIELGTREAGNGFPRIKIRPGGGTLQGGVFYGEGEPPELIIGAKVGDSYLDLLTGTIYQLEPGA